MFVLDHSKGDGWQQVLIRLREYKREYMPGRWRAAAMQLRTRLDIPEGLEYVGPPDFQQINDWILEVQFSFREI